MCVLERLNNCVCMDVGMYTWNENWGYETKNLDCFDEMNFFGEFVGFWSCVENSRMLVE